MIKDVLNVNGVMRSVYVFRWKIASSIDPQIFRFSVPADSDKVSDIHKLYRAVRAGEVEVLVRYHDSSVKSWAKLAHPDADRGYNLGYINKCFISFVDSRGVRYHPLISR